MNPNFMHETAVNEPAPGPSRAGRPGDTWWSRNRIRVLVAGCCGAVILFFGGIAFIVIASLAVLRSSGACREAVARAEAAPAVVQALGAPLEVGWFVNGTLDPGRNAELTIPVTGPRGEARLYVVASKTTGEWVFSTLTVKLMATGERISLVGRGQPFNPLPPPAASQNSAATPS